MRYVVIQFENKCFGVKDTQSKILSIVAAGMTEVRAIEVAKRLNLREAWGI